MIGVYVTNKKIILYTLLTKNLPPINGDSFPNFKTYLLLIF